MATTCSTCNLLGHKGALPQIPASSLAQPYSPLFLPDIRPHLLDHRSQKRWDLNLPPDACFLPLQVSRCLDLPGPWAWKQICWGQKFLQAYCVLGLLGAFLSTAGPDTLTQRQKSWVGGRKGPQVFAECCPLPTSCPMPKSCNSA